MKLNELKFNEGSRSSRKRKGRGYGTGNGKTAGRGENGQKSRSGWSKRLGFEGGQTPLNIRLPKRGFTNKFRKEYAIVNLETLNLFDNGTVITPELLLETGVVSKQLDGIKILGQGNLEKELTVEAHKFSKSAQIAIEKNGKIKVIK